MASPIEVKSLGPGSLRIELRPGLSPVIDVQPDSFMPTAGGSDAQTESIIIRTANPVVDLLRLVLATKTLRISAYDGFIDPTNIAAVEQPILDYNALTGALTITPATNIVGALTNNGVPVVVTAAVVAGVAAGYKIARGVHTQVAAADTVVTGLTTVVAVIASWQSAPTVKQLFITADIGNQSGAPAAGSVLISTFKPTAVNDVTPIAASDFTENLKIGWVAVGT